MAYEIDVVESSHHRINSRGHAMRITLDIDKDVLLAAQELARRQHVSLDR